MFVNRDWTFEFTLENKGQEINFYGLRISGGNLGNIVIDYAEVARQKRFSFSQ